MLYFQPNQSFLWITLSAWSVLFSYQQIRKIESIDSPRGHYLATIPLTRSQTDPGLEIAKHLAAFSYCDITKIYFCRVVSKGVGIFARWDFQELTLGKSTETSSWVKWRRKYGGFVESRIIIMDTIYNYTIWLKFTFIISSRNYGLSKCPALSKNKHNLELIAADQCH